MRYLRDDVPPALAGELLQLLLAAGVDAARHGARPSSGFAAVVRELHAASVARPPVTLPTPSAPLESSTVELSVAEVSAALGCSAQWVQHLARTGRVRARRAGQRAWLIDATDLDRYRHRRESA